MVNPDLSLAVTFWAASSPPALRATLVISRLGEERAGAGRSQRPGQVRAERGMSQWKPGRLLRCVNGLEKPGQATGNSRSCLPVLQALGLLGEVASSLAPREQTAAPSPRVTSLRSGACSAKAGFALAAWRSARRARRARREGLRPGERPGVEGTGHTAGGTQSCAVRTENFPETGTVGFGGWLRAALLSIPAALISGPLL